MGCLKCFRRTFIIVPAHSMATFRSANICNGKWLIIRYWTTMTSAKIVPKYNIMHSNATYDGRTQITYSLFYNEKDIFNILWPFIVQSGARIAISWNGFNFWSVLLHLSKCYCCRQAGNSGKRNQIIRLSGWSDLFCVESRIISSGGHVIESCCCRKEIRRIPIKILSISDRNRTT